VGLIILSYPDMSLDRQVDPSIINGILTGFTIIFGFVTFEIREIKAQISEKFLLSMPLILILISAIAKYSGDIFGYGYPTYWSLVAVLVGVIFSALYSLEIGYAKQAYQELNDLGIKWEWEKEG